MTHGSDPADAAATVVRPEPVNAPETALGLGNMLEQGLGLLPAMRESADETARAELLHQLSRGFAALGLHHEALQYATEAVDAAQGRGAEALLCRCAFALGSAQRELGQDDDARRTLTDTLRLARALESRDQVRDVLLGLSQLALRCADVATRSGDEGAAQIAHTQARDYAGEALEIVRASAQSQLDDDVLCRLGACLTACGQLEAARAVLGDAHSQAVRHGDALLKLRADVGLAETQWADQDQNGTLVLISQVLDSARTLRDDDVRLRAHLLLYKLHKQQGDAAAALEHLEQSQSLQAQRAETLRVIQVRLTRQRIGQERSRSALVRRPPARDPWAATSTMAMFDGGRTSSELAAIQDPITGMGNRRHVERELPRLLALTERRKSTLSIALVEVDHLRSVTERFGRPVRDAVLRTLAELMQTHTRMADLIGRTGPEEFVLVMCDATRDGAREACERLRHAVQDHAWDALAASLSVTTSIGLCELGGKLNAAQLLARADRALYFARSKGGNRIVLADDTM